MDKHFVVFYSPGTLFAENTSCEIASWDVEVAKEMAHEIRERHSATPYGFCFVTRSRNGEEFDSHESARSKMYFLGGKIETLAEVIARGDPSECILRSNMEGNGWDRIITNTNSWKVTQPFEDGDVLLDFTPRKKEAVNA